MAEGEGFEPPEPCGSAVFKTAAIDHSATLPRVAVKCFLICTLPRKENKRCELGRKVKSATRV
jgi:hypothetical protein